MAAKSEVAGSFKASSTRDKNPVKDTVDGEPELAISHVASVESDGLDDAYHVYKESADVPVEAAEDRKVRRRIDLQIMPLLVITYTLQYLDKNSLNFASVYGLQKATGLNSQRYSWVGSIFYVSASISPYQCCPMNSSL